MRVQPVGATFARGSRLTAVSTTNDRIDLFGRGPDKAIWHSVWDGTWRKAYRVGQAGVVASSPTVASWAPGRLDLFGRSPGGHLVHYWSDNSGSSWAWEGLGQKLLTGDPTAVSWGPGRIDLFSLSPDDDLQHMWWNAQQWNDWQPWIDADNPAFGSGPVISASRSGQLDLVVRDHSGSLTGRHFENGGWSAWQRLGAVPARQGEAPGLVSWADGAVTAMVRGELEDDLWNADIRWPWAPE